MNIYLAHSTGYDYKHELYEPLKQLAVEDTFYLPYDDENNGQNSKEIIKDSDVVIAEVSYASTGQGIELGWANSFNKEIVCVFKSGSQFSQSLDSVSSEFIEYESAEDLVTKLRTRLENSRQN